jgi:hypothetical protein
MCFYLRHRNALPTSREGVFLCTLHEIIYVLLFLHKLQYLFFAAALQVQKVGTACQRPAHLLGRRY